MKRSRLLPIILVCLATLVSGCAAKLEIYQKDQEEKITRLKGIPFRVPVLHVIESELKEWIDGKCVIRSTAKFASLPSKEVYYAFQGSGLFSDSKFVMNLDDKGNLKDLSVSSESKVPESTKKLVDAAFKITSHTQKGGRVEEPKEECKGEKIISVVPLWEWIDKVNKASRNQIGSESSPE